LAEGLQEASQFGPSDQISSSNIFPILRVDFNVF